MFLNIEHITLDLYFASSDLFSLLNMGIFETTNTGMVMV